MTRMPCINLLNVDINTGLATKIIYPTLNGGINRITISSDLLATSQYINGQRTATLAELQISPSTMAQVNPITVQSSFDWHTEKIYFTMRFYDGKVVQNFPDDDEVSYATDDVEHYTTVISDVYTSFMFNNGIFGGWFNLVTLTQNDAGTIIPDPLDTMAADKASELRINMDQMVMFSDQWLINVKQITQPKRRSAMIEIKTKVGFAIIDQNGTVLSSKMQSFVKYFYSTHCINTQVDSVNKYFFLDITQIRQSHPTSKYLTIRQYCNSSGSLNHHGEYAGILEMTPLNSFKYRELVHEKYQNHAPIGTTILNDDRLGVLRRIGGVSIPTTSSLHYVFPATNTKSFRQLNGIESPWIECATTGKITAIELDIQDEYGQTFTPATKNKTIPVDLVISFTDVPEDYSI